ncbi:MAG: tetratricopeptide repeat protein, partial [Muribaculaceae bacterium]|nr:tetratricopeptide repeat protein [Muribaculaceae bacterium]
MKRILFALISTLISLCSSATDLVAQADSAYTSEDYRTAAKLYTRAIEEDGASATVLYNLGNTYFRMGSIGKSILNYERALKLNPSFKDARTNLAHIHISEPTRQ